MSRKISDDEFRLRMANSKRLMELLDEASRRIDETGGIPHDEFWKRIDASTKEIQRTSQAKGGKVMRAVNVFLSAMIACVGLVAGCIGGEPTKKEPRQLVFNEATADANSDKTESSKTSAVQSDKKASNNPVGKQPKQLLSGEEIADGWIQLFDSESLFGWKPNSDVNWSVTDGVITADKGTKPGLLLTSVPFADFELRCDFWMAKGGNSGVFLRTPEVPTDPGVDCYELNICDTHPQGFNTASFVKRQKPTKEVSGEEAWKTFHVRAEGPRVVVKLDGEEVLDFTDKTAKPLKSGYIGLQMNQGLIKFRNVFLKPLDTKDLFNGKDLTGWREVPGSKSKFEVIDGAIHVTNGQGYLETEKTWKDFVLQAEVKTNGDALNSGIFFRGLPGKEGAYPGYEFQIQNGIKNNDRSQPADFGTGAIFRRKAARFVVSNDREWTTLTLVTHGLTFATWVNGIPITVWTDDRKPHASGNAREGQRLDAGHFSLQGHDPTTNLDFRNIRAAELP